MLEALFLLYFLVLLATLVFKSRIVTGPWLFLLRAFFPNWKFFHATGNVPPRVRHQMTQVVDSYRASFKLATTKGSTERLESVF